MHDWFDLSHVRRGKVLQMTGGENTSNEQSLPPKPWLHEQIPKIFELKMNNKFLDFLNKRPMGLTVT